MSKNFIVIIPILIMLSVTAQDAAVIVNKGGTAGRPGGLVFDQELSFGGKITTAGWGISSTYSKRIDQDRERLLFFDMMFMKHPKELKKVNEYNFSFGFDSPRPFIYAKQNSFFNLKAGYGNTILIGEKAEKSGFEVSFTYAGGPSIGMLKPYYLAILYQEEGSNRLLKEDQKYSPETASAFLDGTSIYGYSGFSKGLGEISVIPGVFGKAGLTFDWASYDEYVKAVEAGIGAEVYMRDVPMMILENNKPYFAYLYLSLHLGKKW